MKRKKNIQIYDEKGKTKPLKKKYKKEKLIKLYW